MQLLTSATYTLQPPFSSSTPSISFLFPAPALLPLHDFAALIWFHPGNPHSLGALPSHRPRASPNQTEIANSHAMPCTPIDYVASNQREANQEKSKYEKGKFHGTQHHTTLLIQTLGWSSFFPFMFPSKHTWRKNHVSLTLDINRIISRVLCIDDRRDIHMVFQGSVLVVVVVVVKKGIALDWTAGNTSTHWGRIIICFNWNR